MTRRRHEVVREIGDGKYIARDATWARPEVTRAFGRALRQELAENQRKLEQLRKEREAAT